MRYLDGVKLSAVKLDPVVLLRHPVTSLLSVNDDVETTLNKLAIYTIFDLATSPLFKTAAEISAIVLGDTYSPITRFGRVPNSFIDQDSPQTPAALIDADIVVLREIGPALSTEIKDHLQIETVGELGRWLPFHTALAILQTAMPLDQSSLSFDNLSQDGNDSANELVPRLGEYPTECHYYKSVVIDQVVTGETTDLKNAGPIDISPTVSSDFGFKAPAIGAILTFAQSWYIKGLTLGNLLHSIALAPGESTRIAVYDWTRTQFASGQENVSESEQLTNATTHNRAVSEVQEAVATEVQSGFSKSSGSSSTSAGGGGLGLSLGPLTIGGSGSSASTKTNAESFSSSSGTRNLAATMNQRVSDSTQQAASSVRDRRASIVKEVSEKEHESVSTRIIANYNHMHALTVQYFEVLEIYHVNVQLHQAERCLFVPMKLVEFNQATIERYQNVLMNAALNRRIRELLSTEFGTVGIAPTINMTPTKNIFDHILDIDRAVLNSNNIGSTSATNSNSNTTATPAATINSNANINTATSNNAANFNLSNAEVARAAMASASISNANLNANLNINPTIWEKNELLRAARCTLVNVTKPGSNTVYLPAQTELEGISFTVTSQNNSAIAITNVHILTPAGTTINLVNQNTIDWRLAESIPLQEIDKLRLTSSSPNFFTGKMTLLLNYGSARFPITIPVEINPNAAAQSLFRILQNETNTELRLHLEQHRLHYSQAIWRALDPSNIALLLSSFTFEGKPVADQIDPNPVMVAGNYLVFRMPAFIESLNHSTNDEDSDATTSENNALRNWQNWLQEHQVILGSEAASEQLIAIPTGGVFAEAVLGRSNSAEKLDATRFWNWQDSPIPLQPPEIAAIQMGSRAQSVDVTPGHLSSPVLNIMNPTSLPDPSGLGAIMGALQNGNMFRNMSGLDFTAKLAESLSTNATNASMDAAKQAAANLSVAAQKDIEEKKIAAQVAMAAMGLPAANAGTPKNISESGALLNTASDMDKKSKSSQSSKTKSGAPITNTTEGADSGSSTETETPNSESDSEDFMPGVPETMLEGLHSENRADNVLSKMTWGNLGTSSGNMILAAGGKQKSGGVGAATTIIYELACYANFPRPWADEVAEIQAIKNAKWLPAAEDFDAMSKAATAASGGTKPYSQIMSTLEDMIVTVTYFAPQAKSFGKTIPSRVKRLNLFLYAGAQTLEFSGTLNTAGSWNSVYGPTLDLNASVVDDLIISNIKTNTANKGTLAALKNAWNKNAEIWIYSSGSVISDALAQDFASLLGAKVKAFTEPFWVLPRYDASQNIILARDEFGIGADFSSASAKRTKKLHDLDVLATRTFNP